MTASDQERMETVWRERARRLARRPVAAGTGGAEVQAVVLGIGEERYGIELADVVEILPLVQATPVPGAPPAFSGVINVHGEIRPVIDLRRLLGIEPVENGNLSRVLLLRRQEREMGLNVERVEQVLSIPSDDLPSADACYTDLPGRYLKRLTRDGLMLLNTEALFAELFKGTNS